VIDNQHKQLIDYINDLHDAIEMPMSETDRKQRIADVVSDAIDYTESHFGFEETLLEDARYPYLKAHKRVHEVFVRRMLDYKDRLNKGEDIAHELLNTLGRWLLNHIRNEDNDYAKYLAENKENAASTQSQGWITSQLSKFFGSKK
jgi:hemerythrin